MSARVTWLLPVRDGMPYLPEALASIEAQTHRDWEVLAWDNGSTDGSADILRQWIPARLPGRVVVDRPMSLGASLAAMVDESRTELLARADADDANEPERLAEQLALLAARPDIVATGSWMQGIDEGGKPTRVYEYPPVDARDVRWLLFFGNHLCHPTMCLRRAAVLAAGNYPDLTPGQDHELWLRLVQVGRIANVPMRLVRYRRHEAAVGELRRGEWAPVARRLAEKYAERLFPGVSAEKAMRVWSYASHMSPERGANRPSLDDVLALARASAAQGGWTERSFLTARSVLHLLAECAPRNPYGLYLRARYRWLCGRERSRRTIPALARDTGGCE